MNTQTLTSEAAEQPAITHETDDRRDHILEVAMELFSQKGFAGTSMSAIARKVGIDQSTMYYWFKSKEHLLDEIVSLHGKTIEYAQLMSGMDGSWSARLYALVYHDVLNLCLLPVDFYELETAAGKDRSRFGGFFDNYHSLAAIIRSLVEGGIQAGEFEHPDPWSCTFNIMVCDEGLQHRYHQGKQGKRLFNDGSSPEHIDCSAESYARMGAFNALSCLTGSGKVIQKAHDEASSHGWLER
ncbi:MAG: TetR/AcrR family transcriptional regulator [Coriobacteriaceae bacterium]|nr:TetR/AcrR family transcriptional regulator [Coriobacteriaceae bacterium]